MIDITSQAAFEQLCEDLNQQPFLAIDTEFIRERTFYPQLALVQIAGSDAEPILIDPLEISNWQPLHDLLLNPEIVKVFHAGRQDIEIFFNQMDTLPVNIYDTQIGAAFLGFGEQVGYGNLVQKVLGVEIQKGDSYTNWLKRPLTESQISYARNDVYYLGTIYKQFKSMAEELGRISWIQEEIDEAYSLNLFQPIEDDLWKKVKKSTSLKRFELPIIQELAKWRFHTAKAWNKPLRFVVRDEVLISLAHRKNLDFNGLQQVRGLPPGVRNKAGHALVAAFESGQNIPKENWPRPDERKRSYPEHIEVIAELAWVLVKETAAQKDLVPNLIIGKKSLIELVSKTIHGKLAPSSLLQGWRQEVIGEQLELLLHGELALLVKNGKLAFHPFTTKS